MINGDPQIANGFSPVEAQVDASAWLLTDRLQDSIYCFVEGGQVQMQLYCVISGIKLLTVIIIIKINKTHIDSPHLCRTVHP